jgi:hypothetical protein
LTATLTVSVRRFETDVLEDRHIAGIQAESSTVRDEIYQLSRRRRNGSIIEQPQHSLVQEDADAAVTRYASILWTLLFSDDRHVLDCY